MLILERKECAEALVAHDAVAICDEVYEHVVDDGARHRPLMAPPGLRERAILIGSAGKTLALTGWKIGYVTAAESLLEPILRAHQFNTFPTPPALQLAVAAGLEAVGARIAPSAGTIFLTADFSASPTEPTPNSARG